MVRLLPECFTRLSSTSPTPFCDTVVYRPASDRLNELASERTVMDCDFWTLRLFAVVLIEAFSFSSTASVVGQYAWTAIL